MKPHENPRPNCTTAAAFADLDSDIAAAVADAIERITTIPPDHIQIVVEHGHVMLRGFVEGRNQKATLEQIVRNVHGVRSVSSSITVGQPTLPAHR